MAEVDKERSLFESVMSALGKPGSLARQLMVDMVEGQRSSLSDFGDILMGDKEVTPDDLVKTVEDRFGVDLTPGSRYWDEKSGGEKAATFARDFVIDVFTSPDSIIGAPAKMLKAQGLVKNPAIAKAVTGATLGFLSTDSNDSFIDIMGKTAIGAATLGTAPKVLRTIGSEGAKVGERYILDPIVKNFNEAGFKRLEEAGIRQSYSQAVKITSRAEKRMLRKQREYINATKKVEQGLARDMMMAGADVDQIKAAMLEFDDLIGKGFGGFVELRKAIKNLMKNKYEVAAGGGSVDALKESEDAFSAVAKKLGISDENVNLALNIDESGRLDPTGALVGINPVVNRKIANKDILTSHEAGNYATKLSNWIVGEEIENLAASKEFGKELQSAIARHRKKNVDLIEGNFNLFARAVLNPKRKKLKRTLGADDLAPSKAPTKDQIQAAFKDGQYKVEPIAETVTTKDYAFIPIEMWTADLKRLDNLVDQDVKIAASTPGARMRLDEAVEASVEGISREQAREIGAEKFARLFLTKTELDARKVLKTVAEGTRASDSKAVKFLNAYDNLLRLAKTVHLVTGSSWIVNNFSDNLLRSYIAAGPSAALKTLGGNTGVTLHALGNMATAGALNNLDRETFYSKMLNVFDPTKNIKKLDYQDNWLNAAADLGVIDSDKFQDFFDMVKRGEAVINVTKNASQKEEMLRFIEGQSDAAKITDNVTKFFWDKVGRIGSAHENTARYITFREVAKSLEGMYPKAKYAITELGADRVWSDRRLLRSGKKFKGTNVTYRESAREARELLAKASKITRDTFFDYNDVNTFERYVMKRIFPYWTFASRNLPFWADKLGDPDAIARVAKAQSVQEAMGRAPTEDERLGTPNYLLEKGARIRGDEFFTTPNLSIVDAVESAVIPGVQTRTAFRKMGNMLAPVPKQAIQQMFDVDLFTGGDLTPSEDRPKKRVFESAATLLPDEALEALGLYRADDGKIFTNSELAARGVSAFRDLPIPGLPLLDQISRARMEVNYRDADVGEAILKQLSPVKSRKISKKERLKRAKQAKTKLTKLQGGKEEVLKNSREKKFKLK